MSSMDKLWDKLGFTIMCKKCGSDQVYIHNSIGMSSYSGVWGSIELTCSKCDNDGVIWEP